MTSATPRRENGFTLVEVCMAVLILAMIAGLSWPGLRRSIKQFRIDADANKLDLKFRAARRYAVMSGKPQTVVGKTGPVIFYPDGSSVGTK